MKILSIFLIYLIGATTCSLYADPQSDLVKSIYATLEKKNFVDKRFAIIVWPDYMNLCEDRLRHRKEEELGVLMQNLGAKNFVRDFSVDAEKSLNPEITHCTTALLKTKKIDLIITVNIIAGVYKGFLYGPILGNRMFHFSAGKTDLSLQITLHLEAEGKEVNELKIHKDIRRLNIRNRYLHRITGMSALTDLEAIIVSDLDLQKVPKFDFDRPYSISLNNNSIRDLHATDFDKNAFSVEMYRNLIEDDVWFCDVDSIKEINIARNKLRATDCLLSNDHVEKVNGSFNYISNISARKIGKNLKSLDLSYNGIRNFPWKLFNESGIKDLDLSNNQIYNIAIIDLMTIEKIDLSKNPLMKVIIGEKSKNLKVLRISPKTIVEFKEPIKRCEADEKMGNKNVPEKRCVSVEYE